MTKTSESDKLFSIEEVEKLWELFQRGSVPATEYGLCKQLLETMREVERLKELLACSHHP